MNVGRGSFRRSRFNTTSNKSLSMETQNCNELARCCLRSNQKHVSRRFPETRKSPIYSRRIFSKHVSFRFRNISHTSHPIDCVLSRPLRNSRDLLSEFAQQTRGGHEVPPLQMQNPIRSRQLLANESQENPRQSVDSKIRVIIRAEDFLHVINSHLLCSNCHYAFCSLSRSSSSTNR